MVQWKLFRTMSAATLSHFLLNTKILSCEGDIIYRKNTEKEQLVPVVVGRLLRGNVADVIFTCRNAECFYLVFAVMLNKSHVQII